VKAGYKKVKIGDKTHVMTIDEYKKHLETLKIVETVIHIPKDKLGNYIDRTAND
jgi:hypothetical protein